MLTTVFLLGGFLVLTIGAEFLVRGASHLALKLGVAPLIVGLTIVGFGTSAPELAVSIKAALANSSGIALGNVIGSNIANIGLILGISAFISPIHVKPEITRIHLPFLIATSILLWCLLIDGALTVIDGCLFISLLIAYLAYSFITGKEDSTDNISDTPNQHAAISIILIIVGLTMLIVGGTYFVDGAVSLAKSLGVSDVVIGLTIVAVGTSMPELVTSVIAAIKKQGDISIGNVIGSNIFNILFILGVASLIAPINSQNFSAVDFSVMIIFCLLLLPMCLRKIIGRAEGALLVIAYFSYLGWLVSNAIT